MKKKNDKMKVRWTIKEVLIGKTFQVIVLTIIISIALIKLANAALTFYGNIGNTSLMRYDYDFGLYSLVLVLPAILFSAIILKVIINLQGKNVNYVSEEEALSAHKKEVRFKWHRAYSIVFGYLVMILMFKGFFAFVDKRRDYTTKSICFHLVLGILCFIIPVVVSNVLNKLMIKITSTNRELIEEMKLGAHNDQIKDKFLNEKDFYGIIKILENAEALSIKSSVAIYRIKVAILKICKAYFVVSVVIGLVVFLISCGAINIFVSEAGMNLKEYNGNNNRGTLDNSKKWHQSKKANKKADFDFYQANKARDYNVNSYDAYKKTNIANASAKEADKLNR